MYNLTYTESNGCMVKTTESNIEERKKVKTRIWGRIRESILLKTTAEKAVH